MRSTQMVKRNYMDGESNPTYYLLHNIPDIWDNLEECYSIVAQYSDGSISQWFFDKDNLKSAFRVYRIMSVNRHM